jgi:hypothetical protein
LPTLPTTDGSLLREDLTDDASNKVGQLGFPDAGAESALEPDSSTQRETGSLPDSGIGDSLPSQSCAPATCYPKSDPNHTTCPCRY